MRISAVMAVYNTERYVTEALESVFAQTLLPDEIIVVDDGSTDRTPEILESFSGRLRVIHQSNKGPGAALNVGVTAATGDCIAFLDADDLWKPQKLQWQSSALASNEDVEAVFGAVQQFSSPEIDPKLSRKYIVSDKPQIGITKSAMMIHRAAFARIGQFAEEFNAADFVEWFVRAASRDLRTLVLPDVVVMRRHHAGNLGRRKRFDQHNDLLQALKDSLDRRRKD
jgi:glycosyltransferase involved in cell wall biosynthesis